MSTIVTKSIDGSAIFDASRQYRYCLTRSWSNTNNKQVTFIMLNPSKADAQKDDPTIRACLQFAKSWKYTQLNVVNLFAFCTSQPSDLKVNSNPIGPENNRYLLASTSSAQQVILAWGNEGIFLNRAQAVMQLLQPYWYKLYYLKRNRSGQPGHPLYIKRTTAPRPWHTP